MDGNALLTPTLSYFIPLRKLSMLHGIFSQKPSNSRSTFYLSGNIEEFCACILKLYWQPPRLFGQSPFHSSKDLEH